MEGVGALGGGEQQDLPRPVGAAGSAYGAAGKVSVRFLVDNHAAGVVIGRNGSNKDELQAQSGASVQLSKPNVFWSGTTDRVLLLSGTHQAILDCLSSIQQLLRQSAGLQDSGSSSSSSSALPTRPGDVVKVLVPAGSCGLILGRGGETVRAVSAETGCMISISPQELSRSLDYDRVVTVSGPLPGLIRAVSFIISCSDGGLPPPTRHVRRVSVPQYLLPAPSATSTTTTVSLQPGPQLQLPQAPSYSQPAPAATFTPQTSTFSMISLQQALQGVQPSVQAPSVLLLGSTPGLVPATTWVEVNIGVPAAHVGAIIGRGGSVLQSLKQLLQVRIVISERDQVDPLTGTRNVRICGPPEAVQMAQQILHQKIAEAAALSTARMSR